MAYLFKQHFLERVEQHLVQLNYSYSKWWRCIAYYVDISGLKRKVSVHAPFCCCK
jgi:hypothetical protein